MKKVICNPIQYKPFDGENLTEFVPATDDEVRKLVMDAASKSCTLYPIPTWLLKKSLPQLVSIIRMIVNSSVSSASLCERIAIVRPTLKKDSLDPNVLGNYRPVSNLSFLSKLIERVVASRLLKHLADNNLHESLQSAYRKNHSTETADIGYRMIYCVH